MYLPNLCYPLATRKIYHTVSLSSIYCIPLCIESTHSTREMLHPAQSLCPHYVSLPLHFIAVLSSISAA